MPNFDDNTVRILDEFSKLNPGIVFTPTVDAFRTTSEDETIIASATLPISFPSIAGVEDIKTFTGKFTLFNEPEVTFSDNQSRFILSEGDVNATPKTYKIPYGNLDNIVQPPLNDPEIEDEVIFTFNLSAADLSTLVRAIDDERYSVDSNELQESMQIPGMDFDLKSAYSQSDVVQNTIDGPITVQSSSFDVAVFQAQVDAFNENVSANNASAPDYNGLQVALLIRAPNTFSLQLARDNAILTDSFEMSISNVGQPNFSEDFDIFFDADFFSKIFSEKEYTISVAPAYEKAKFSTTLDYVEYGYDQAAYEAELATYNQEVTEYQDEVNTVETQTENIELARESNQQIYNDTKETLIADGVASFTVDYVDAVTAQTPPDPLPEYAPPDPADIVTAAENAGWDPNFDQNNPLPDLPTPPTPPEAGDATNIYFISSITYWSPVVYQSQP